MPIRLPLAFRRSDLSDRPLVGTSAAADVRFIEVPYRSPPCNLFLCSSGNPSAISTSFRHLEMRPVRPIFRTHTSSSRCQIHDFLTILQRARPFHAPRGTSLQFRCTLTPGDPTFQADHSVAQRPTINTHARHFETSLLPLDLVHATRVIHIPFLCTFAIRRCNFSAQAEGDTL